MRFGLGIPNHGNATDVDQQISAAKKAEEKGYDSVWTDDHIIVPKRFEKEYGFMNEALITLAYIAARTETVKLGTSVIVLPQRNPILLAKQISTLHNLSGGRAILGVGAGWMEEEFNLLGAGATYHKRGAFLDESIDLIRKLWTDNPVNFQRRFFNLDNGIFLPKPKEPIPIWIGGKSDAAIERAAKFGDAYHPLWISPSELEEKVRKLRQKGSNIPVSLRMPVDMRHGRKVVTRTSGTKMYQIAGTRTEITKEIESYITAGTDHLLVEFEAENGEVLLNDIETFAKDIMESFN